MNGFCFADFVGKEPISIAIFNKIFILRYHLFIAFNGICINFLTFPTHTCPLKQKFVAWQITSCDD